MSRYNEKNGLVDPEISSAFKEYKKRHNDVLLSQSPSSWIGWSHSQQSLWAFAAAELTVAS